MRLLLIILAMVLTSAASSAQIQHPTTPPRLVQQKTTNRNVRKKVAPKKKVMTRKTRRVVKKKTAPAPVAPAPAPAAPAEQPKQSLIESHLQIRYFGSFTGPNMFNSDGDWAYPDVNKNGNYSPSNDPMDTWNQLSFRWKIAEGYHAFINPRWTIQHASTKRIRKANAAASAAGQKTADAGMFRNEDWLIGVQGTAWSDPASGWSWFIRPGYRLPTSRDIRNAGWSGQIEWFQSLDWVGKGNWSFGFWHQIRYYVPSYKDPLKLNFATSDGSNPNERHRQYFALYSMYNITDTVKWETYYQMNIHHNYEKGQANRSFFYYKRNRWDNYIQSGISFPVNPSLSLYPYLYGYQVGTFDPDTIGYGLWIMAAFY